MTHTLVAQTLLGNAHPRIILGGIFPDLGTAIGLNRDVTHAMGRDFYQFCREGNPEFLDFAQAVISHGSDPRGLDYYADQSFAGKDTGYCFQRAVPLVDKVVAACGIPPDMGLWKAHNFIEMAYEVIAVEKHPHLTESVFQALSDDQTVHRCSQVLARYFGLDTGKIEMTFRQMPHFFCLSQVTPLHLAEKYAVQLEKRHQVHTADIAAMTGVIQEAREQVEEEFPLFINGSLTLISPVITQFPRCQDEGKIDQGK
ncbi:hypothetical protein [Candidatus Formimonas warabiya]|uniref:hypothetical protein n=1 Tax=Formimonas warabiya TaxID=1761012 RepID=UPI0011D15309|nr:hypothetical protein [Candidatus Formimonas warabiya]